jgi:hypothetical protein
VICLWRNEHERHWPWEAKELNPQEAFMKSHSHGESIWLLKTSIIVGYCISYSKCQISTPVGDLICLRWKVYNNTTQETQWWGAPNYTEPQPHPLATLWVTQSE